MDTGALSIAIISYLTGAMVVYAYINRNRYIDLIFASISIFSFGTAMLFRGFTVLPGVSNILTVVAETTAILTAFFLLIRISQRAYEALMRYLSSK